MANPVETGSATIWDQMMELREQQRQDQEKALLVIKGKDLPWELNPHGFMKWFLHPMLKHQPLKSVIFYEQRIDPNSRTGRQLCQGGVVYFVKSGRGHSTIDGVRHPWKQGDLIQLPLRVPGITFQHFNDSDEPVILVCCEANQLFSLNVDKGSGFEVVEEAPEYRQAKKQG